MRRALLLALLVTTPVLAGCVTDLFDDRPEAATLVCLGDPETSMPTDDQDPGAEGPDPICNIEATVDPATRQANELSIAVNPTDPDNILVSGKDYTPEEAGDCVWDGLYVTHDGGETWENSNLPGSNWRRLADPTYPAHPDFSRFWCATDPVVAFGPDGTAYWTVMPYQCDPLSGSKTGEDVHPQGGFNDWFWTCSSIYVLVSEDGGETWPIVREVAFGPRLEHDKQWLSVAPNGDVLLCWDRDPSYQTSQGTPADQLTNAGYMVCSVSTDKGRTWSEVTDVNPPGTWDGILPWVDWGPNGTAWMAALNSEQILVSKSQDGLSWTRPTAVGGYTNPPPGGPYGWPVLEGSAFRVFALPSIAVDRSDGPYSGSVYVTWFDHTLGDGDVLLTYSRDGGESWSQPQRVHDDAPDSGVDQFMPAVSVGPDGTVDVVWFDRRVDPQDTRFDLFHAYSVDGGETFSENLRVSEVSSEEEHSRHQNGMVFLGDYIEVDSVNGSAYPVWVDTRHGQADAFIARIDRPSANLEAE